jgi:hypothetical protein
MGPLVPGSDLSEMQILAFAYCIVRALAESKGTENPGNDVYWFTREKIFEDLGKLRMKGRVDVIKIYNQIRFEIDRNFLERMTEDIWHEFAHPELIIRSVHNL